MIIVAMDTTWLDDVQPASAVSMETDPKRLLLDALSGATQAKIVDGSSVEALGIPTLRADETDPLWVAEPGPGPVVCLGLGERRVRIGAMMPERVVALGRDSRPRQCDPMSHHDLVLRWQQLSPPGGFPLTTARTIAGHLGKRQGDALAARAATQYLADVLRLAEALARTYRAKAVYVSGLLPELAERAKSIHPVLGPAAPTRIVRDSVPLVLRGAATLL